MRYKDARTSTHSLYCRGSERQAATATRAQNCSAITLSVGYGKISIIGADSPLGPADIRQRRVASPDVHDLQYAQFPQTNEGASPIDYLTGWRMMVARSPLKIGGGPVAALAEKMGCMSDTALSAAFKRTTRGEPGEFPRRQRLTLAVIRHRQRSMLKTYRACATIPSQFTQP